jgi:hypothetical protein
MTVLIIIGAVLAAIITAFIIELLIAALFPRVSVPRQNLAGQAGKTMRSGRPGKSTGRMSALRLPALL